jgi:hypothetical protein
MAIAAAGRRADRDEDDIGGGDRGCEILREIQTAGGAIMRDDRIKARFENRHLAGFERVDLCFGFINTGDVMTEIGQAGTRDKADIA